VSLLAGCRHCSERLRGRVGKEVGSGEDVFVSHDAGHGTTLRGCAAC
jgi:hypothetical protein